MKEELTRLQRDGKIPEGPTGIRIVTTLDRESQLHAHYLVRRELSHRSMQLEGYPKSGATEPERMLRAEEMGFYNVKVEDIIVKGDKSNIVVRFGNGRQGIIDYNGLHRTVEAYQQHKEKGTWAKAAKKDVEAFLKNMHKGDIVLVSVRDLNDDILADLEQPAAMQGAYVYLQPDGRIKAIVGSNNNRDFNHAIAAHPPGSALKPMLAALAMTLGWDLDDTVQYTPKPFFYGTQTYIPQNSHHDPFLDITLFGALALSSNVAHVDLLYKLLDKIPPEKYQELVKSVGMAQKEGESDKAYYERLRDQFGLQWNDAIRERVAYERAKSAVLASQGTEIQSILKDLSYGHGYNELRAELKGALRGQKTDEKRAIVGAEITRTHFNYLELLNPSLPAAAGSGTSITSASVLYHVSGEADTIPADVLNMIAQEMRRAETPKNFTEHPDFKVRVAMRVFKQWLQKLGIQHAATWEEVPSIVIGSQDASPLELAAAYETLITGQRCTPYLIQEVYLGQENVYQAEPHCTAIPELTLEIRAKIMQAEEATNIAGTAKRLGSFHADGEHLVYEGMMKIGNSRVPNGGKTGTGQKNESLTYVLVVPSYESLTPQTLTEGVDLKDIEAHVTWLGQYGGAGKQNSLRHGSITLWGSTSGDLAGRIVTDGYTRASGNETAVLAASVVEGSNPAEQAVQHFWMRHPRTLYQNEAIVVAPETQRIMSIGEIPLLYCSGTPTNIATLQSSTQENICVQSAAVLNGKIILPMW